MHGMIDMVLQANFESFTVAKSSFSAASDVDTARQTCHPLKSCLRN